MSETANVTAAALAIGDELLSGRTKDKNIGHLAEMLTAAGIELEEVRIVPDDQQRIVEALNALRARYTYVFTSGGIGPTHDDITADAIAAAFGVACVHDAEAIALLGAMYAERGMEFTEARRRMARMPVGSRHIDNPVSGAPGFVIGNVYVMAGVPAVFQAMLDNVLPTLQTGIKILSDKVDCPYGEGEVGDALAVIAKAHPDVNIGSYPRYSAQSFSTEIVIRGRDPQAIASAKTDVEAMLSDIASRKTASTV
ncbi:molybdopterin-binding protein [Hoeflea sp.]|uniref:competence/damage-inducible protein A n=1 Tax=Hoeflea sp. TaxID=1940281 RepID=UPI002AFE6EA7|nr:molybdopterin-binding protein [Hoeflea sp.]